MNSLTAANWFTKLKAALLLIAKSSEREGLSKSEPSHSPQALAWGTIGPETFRNRFNGFQ